MKVLIIDYGMGNLGSVKTAVKVLGFKADIVNAPQLIKGADKIILPGVGSFSDAMSELKNNNWFDPLSEHVFNEQKPILGICLGMQLLATTGQEGGQTEGLDFIPGQVSHLTKLGCEKPIPHVGWNDTHVKNKSILFKGIESGNDFFYVHSYGFLPSNPSAISSIVNYDGEIVASIEKDNVFGTQFHPEKSSKAGLKLLKNFLDL